MAVHNGLHFQVSCRQHNQPATLFFTPTFSAFEGIGTIVAIESSMRSPRHHFPRLIAVAIACVLVILCGFGTACYGFFGLDTKQVITLNLSDGSSLVVALCV
jgi:amino acid permease